MNLKHPIFLLVFSTLVWAQTPAFFSNEIAKTLQRKDFKRTLNLCDKAKQLPADFIFLSKSQALEGLDEFEKALEAAEKIETADFRLQRTDSIRSNALFRLLVKSNFTEVVQKVESQPEPRKDFESSALSSARAGLGQFAESIQAASKISNHGTRLRQLAQVYTTRKWYNQAMRYHEEYFRSLGDKAVIGFTYESIDGKEWPVPQSGIMYDYSKSATNLGASSFLTLPMDSYRWRFQSVMGIDYYFSISYIPDITSRGSTRDSYMAFLKRSIKNQHSETYTTLVKNSPLTYLSYEEVLAETNFSTWTSDNGIKNETKEDDGVVLWYISHEKNDASTFRYFFMPSPDAKYSSDLLRFGVTYVTIRCPSEAAKIHLKNEWSAWMAYFFDR